MTWIYEALEMHDKRRRPLGKFRVVRWEDDHPEALQGLCDHYHTSVEEALNCPIANGYLDQQFSDVPRVTEPKLS